MSAKAREYFINFSTVTDSDSLQDRLQACLPLPDYYGRNWDALYDCLTDMGPAVITLSGLKWLEPLGKAAELLPRVFRDAAEENKNLTLIWER